MKINRIWRRATALSAAFLTTIVTTWALASVVDPAVVFDHVPPFGGNPVKCAGPDGSNTFSLGYDNVLAIDGYPNGTYNFVVQGSNQSVTVTQTSGGIDWTSTYPIQAVIMKGSDAANVYPYVLPPNAGNAPISGVTDWNARTYVGSISADTDLNFPAGSSHVEFCYDNDEPIVIPPDITKTADGSWIRNHDWTLDKEADPTAIEMYDGDTHDVDYTIEVTKTPWGTFTVSGVIEISDPFDQGFSVNSVADTIIFGADVTDEEFHPTLNCADVDDATDVIHRCSYELTLSSKVYTYLAAGGGGVNSATADLDLNAEPYGIIGPATANFTFPAEPDASYGDSLAVDDTMLPDDPDHTFTDDGTFPYVHTFACDADEGDNPNTATGTFSTGAETSGEVMDDENVNVDCHDVDVEKTALTRFDRDFDWTPDKGIVVRPDDLTVEEKAEHCTLLDTGPYATNYLCDDITIKIPMGSVYDTVYSLTATKDSGTDSGMQVYGVITVSWPADAPEPVFTGDPVDVLTYAAGLPASIDAVVSNCVPGTNQITCDYVADVDDQRSGTNTASIERPHVCYAADDSIQVCEVPGSSTYDGTADFSFGDPSDTADDCVALSDLFNGTPGLNLGPMPPEFPVDDEVCDSTTLYLTGSPADGVNLDIYAEWAPEGFEEFDPQCTFYVPNLLKLALDDGLTRSDEAVIGVYVPDACNQGCTLTQGYWKTHAIYAPKPQFAKKRDDHWDMVGAQAENTVFFLSGKSWIQVFWTPPKGNPYYNLAHQYMAAILNGYAGASTTPAVDTAIANAEAWFNAYGPNHGFWKANKQAVMQAAGVLGSYNEGDVGPGHCSEAPVASFAAKAKPIVTPLGRAR